VLPVFVPLAVLAFEPTGKKRRLMIPFAVIGSFVAGVLLAALVRGPFGVRMQPFHLAYSLRVHDGFLIIVLYVVAVCGALLLSGERHIVIFGIVNLVAIAVIARLTVDGFASVWCGWAAICSGAIAAEMRLVRTHHTSRAAAAPRTT
jgi:hypothetical protein